jgi:cationic peptide transport system permease protein
VHSGLRLCSAGRYSGGDAGGIYRNKWQDKFISALALLGFSIPIFWLALLLTLFFSLTLGWLPVSGRFDLLYTVKTVTGFAIIDAWLSDSVWRHEMIISALRHMVLPVLTLAVAPTTEVIRLMRISTIECLIKTTSKRPPRAGVAADDPAPPRTAQRPAAGHPAPGLQFSTMLTLAMITKWCLAGQGLVAG